jgi:hypothetical protein
MLRSSDKKEVTKVTTGPLRGSGKSDRSGKGDRAASQQWQEWQEWQEDSGRAAVRQWQKGKQTADPPCERGIFLTGDRLNGCGVAGRFPCPA